MPRVGKINRPWVKAAQYTKVHDSFYDSSPWRRLKAAHIREFPFCAQCERKGFIVNGKIVDHKLPRRLFPELELERTNLQTLCPVCDNTKRQVESLCNDRSTCITLLTKHEML